MKHVYLTAIEQVPSVAALASVSRMRLDVEGRLRPGGPARLLGAQRELRALFSSSMHRSDWNGTTRTLQEVSIYLGEFQYFAGRRLFSLI